MSETTPIPKAVAHRANRWFARRTCGLMTSEDEARLAVWLAADPLHERAFRRAAVVYDALGAAFPAEAGARRSRRGRGAGKRPTRRQGIALGASLAVATVLGVVVLDLPPRLATDAATGVGEHRLVALADGSTVLLNTDSAIAIDYGAQRKIRLLRGEAAFTVAPDPARPFRVETSGGSAVALGTRFIVHRIGDGARVTVTEHVVRVARPVHGRPGAVDVDEGHAVTYGRKGVSSPTAVAVEDEAAWTRGRLRFVDRPLGEVVTELNRYHKGRIVLLGGDVKTLKVSGVFDVDDPAGAVEVVRASLGLRARRLVGDRWIVLHR